MLFRSDVAKTTMTSDSKDGKNTQQRANDPNFNGQTASSPVGQIEVGTFAINAGTSIQSVIDTVIVNSEYVVKQLTNSETNNKQQGSQNTVSNPQALAKATNQNTIQRLCI